MKQIKFKVRVSGFFCCCFSLLIGSRSFLFNIVSFYGFSSFVIIFILIKPCLSHCLKYFFIRFKAILFGCGIQQILKLLNFV